MSDVHSRRAETRARITAAAHELFAAHGYDSVSVAAIAEAAGVTERTVFRHFPEKHQLAYPEASEHLTALRKELRERAAPGAVTHDVLADAVVAVFARIMRAGEADRVELRGRMFAASDELRDRIYGTLSGWRDELTGELTPYLDGDEDAACIAATAMVTIVIDTVRWWLCEGAAVPLDEVARRVADKHQEAYAHLLAG